MVISTITKTIVGVKMTSVIAKRVTIKRMYDVTKRDSDETQTGPSGRLHKEGPKQE